MNSNADIAVHEYLSRQPSETLPDDVTKSTNCGLQDGGQEFYTPRILVENLPQMLTEQMNININDAVEMNKSVEKFTMKRPIHAIDMDTNGCSPSKKSLHLQDLSICSAPDVSVINSNEIIDSNLAKFTSITNCIETTIEVVEFSSDVQKTTIDIKHEHLADDCNNNDYTVINEEPQESKLILHTIPVDNHLDTKDTVCKMKSFNGNDYSDFTDIKIALPFDNISDEMKTIEQTKPFYCTECGIFVDLKKYEVHVETTEHKIAVVDYFKERIDFNNYYVFSPSLCSTMVDFFSFIKEDFTILVNYVIKKHTSVEGVINLYALYHDECSSLNNNKYLAEVKCFGVKNKVLTKEIDVELLYGKIASSLMFQCETFQTSGWSLEEILWLEIVITKSLVENEPSTIINSSDSLNTNLNKSIPEVPKMRLVRCRPCGIYITRDNYSEHIDMATHKKSASKYISDRVMIIDGPSGNRIKGYRVLSSTQCVSMTEFFTSIESDILSIVDQTLLDHSKVNMNVQLFSHYNDSTVKTKTCVQENVLVSYGFMGQVKSFMIKNEIITRTSSLLSWYQNITEKLISHNDEMLSKESTWSLDRVMFFEIYFYKKTYCERKNLFK